MRELAITAQQREATVVLTIDQAEELFRPALRMPPAASCACCGRRLKPRIDS